jgi:DNA-binding SARP family transcriptional activator
MTLTIRLLGTPAVHINGRPVGLARRKMRALLYYLADSAEPLHREKLLNLFWPDSPRPSAQQTLRTTLHGLRTELGHFLVSTDEYISLSPEVDVDTRRFRVDIGPAAGLAELSGRLDLYRGDFLENFELPDAPAFEDWLLLTREQYRRQAARGLSDLSRRQAAQGDYPAALAYLERALAFDPLQEDLQRETIRLLYLSGDRASAIRRYDALRRMLDDELGVPPMAETRLLYDEIIKDNPSVAQSSAGLVSRPRPPLQSASPETNTLPFTGRKIELAWLEQTTGAHKLALIIGETGIGKTRLAGEFIRARGEMALAGAARELEQRLPYQPFIEAMRTVTACPDWPALRASLRQRLAPVWQAEAAILMPELTDAPDRSPATGQIDESRLWEGVAQFLIALSSLREFVLFLDDLQWADASSLGLLGYVARRIVGTPIRLIVNSRPLPARSPVATLTLNLTREGLLEQIQLASLTPDEIAEVSGRLSPQYTYPLSAWLNDNSEGNPYLLAEMVRYARDNGLLSSEGILNLTGLSSSPVVPKTVYSMIKTRLERLADPPARMLEAAATIGREFEFDVVAHAACLSEDAAMEAFSQLQADGLIEPVGNKTYRFNHSLIMEVANRETAEPRQTILHRRVGEAMEAVYPPGRLDTQAGILAWHFTQGNVPVKAAPYALRAAQNAARLAAWDETIRLYEMAQEGLKPKQTYPALMALGDAYFNAGKVVQAADTFRKAVAIVEQRPEIAPPEESALQLAGALLPQARFDEAINLARMVLERGDPHYTLQAEFLWGTVLSIEGSDLRDAARHLRAAEKAAAAQPETSLVQVSRIQFELGSVAAQQGDLQAAISLYSRALEIACQASDTSTLVWCALAHNNLAYHLLLAGEAGAEEHALAGLKITQEYGLIGQQPYLYSTLGEIELARGDLGAAEANFRQGLQVAERLGLGERIAGLTANLGLVALRCGDTPLAIHRLSMALARADALGTLHLAAQIRLWLAPLLPMDEARQNLAQVRAFAQSSGRQRLLDELTQVEENLSKTAH